MATNKKSFILYSDLIYSIEGLSDIEAGLLFKHLLRYVNDLNPVTDDRIVNIAFEPIKQQLKRDLKDWEETIKGKSEGGKKSAEVRKKLRELEDSLSILKNPKDTSSNSTDNVTDNVNVTVNDIYKELNESQIWLELASKSLQSKSVINTQRLLKNFFNDKMATGELEGKSIDEVKRWFINATKKLPLSEINPNLGFKPATFF